jgi:hypothetical protein
VGANVASSTTYVLTATGPGGSVTCSTPITVTTPGLSCQLSISSSSIAPGQSATLSWSSNNASTGTIDNNVGTVSPVSGGSVTVFPPSSTTYHGTFTGPSGTVTCTVPITVTTGGCSGNCGGGLNQPNVSLFKKPGQQPLAFVSLSQIPYTGFEAGPALTFIFWLAIAGLSAFVAYGITGPGSLRHVMAYVLGGFVGVPVRYAEEAEGEADTHRIHNRPYPSFEEESSLYENGHASVAAPAPVHTAPVAPVSMKHPRTPIPALQDVIESRAHAAGVLMSPEAVALAADISRDRTETLRRFGAVIDEAVKTIPREDGWIMLTTDRLQAILSANPAPVLPDEHMPLAGVDEHAAVEFAGAVVSGDRTNAFAIIRSLEHDHVSPTALMTATASVIDKLYRARRDNRQVPDAAFADKAASVSDEKLAHLVEVFTHALDHVYASPFTGVKLALAQAFESLA